MPNISNIWIGIDRCIARIAIFPLHSNRRYRVPELRHQSIQLYLTTLMMTDCKQMCEFINRRGNIMTLQTDIVL